MIKTIIITLNLFLFLAYKLFIGGEVTAEQKLPEVAMAGEKFVIEVTLNKSDHEGFAKWQQTLPEGFIATSKENQGATFSFKNQEVKLIWMALPKEENVTISYEVISDPETQGEFEIGGKFSYIEENERRDVEAPAKMVKISNEQMATNGFKEDSLNEQENDTVLNASADSHQQEEMNNSEQLVTDQDGLKIYRTVTPLEGAKHSISLRIEKGDLQSFGKVEEYMPSGFIASADENSDGMFSFDGRVMKILWMTIPKNKTLKVKYTVESTTDELDMVQIHGVFSYLNEDESMQAEMKPTTIENDFIAETDFTALLEEMENEAKNENSSKELADSTEEEAENIVAELETDPTEDEMNEETLPIDRLENETAAASTEKKIIEDITNIPSPETSISYKVQIAAARKEVSQQYFIDRHGIKETVSIEFHDNWYKYTLGGYEVYREARDHRNKIWAAKNKINDAFVTAYNSGSRITVQEALMISNQKWFK